MLKNLKLHAVLLLSGLLTAPLANANTDSKTAVIKPFTAEYSIIRKSDPIGVGTRQLEYLKSGKARYSYHSELSWLIFSDERSEESVISIENGQITPVSYKYERTGTGKDKFYEWEYNIDESKALNVEKGVEKHVEFPENIQDSLSYHFQQRLNLLNNPEQKHFVYPVIRSSGKIKNYVYQYDGEEEILLPYGLVKTIRLKREVVEKKKITYAWFAPELDYLLVKLYQMKSGVEQLQAQLKSVTINE